MARQYDNLGSGDQVPTVNRSATPDVSRVQPSDWSVLALVDGKRTIAAICGGAVMPEADAARSLARLLTLGMISLPSTPPILAPPMGASTIRPSRTVAARKPEKQESRVKKGAVRTAPPSGWPVAFERFAFDAGVMAEVTDLSEEKRRQILYYHHHLKLISYYDLFQVPRTADERVLRKAYFKLSKEFHPDQFFRKSLGSFESKIADVFKWLSTAYMVLSDADKRKGYDAILARGHVGEWAVPKLGTGSGPSHPTSARGISAQMPTINSNELALQGERKMGEGDFAAALRLLESSLKLTFEPRVAVLAAECLVEMNTRLDVADGYCRRAIKQGLVTRDKPLAYIVLARILERVGRIDDARKVFQQARRLDPDNPTIRTHLDRIDQTSS